MFDDKVKRIGYRVTYNSVGQLAEDGIKNIRNKKFHRGKLRKDFDGIGHVSGVRDLAVDGWQDEVVDAMAIADQAVTSVETEVNTTNFRPMLDMSGCEVDMDRYLAGEPENMIDYEITAPPKAGRVITLCASVAVSGSVEPGDITKRGQGIAALVFALQRLGLNVELWADMTSLPSFGGGDMGKGVATQTRVLVKGANDEVDPGRILFAFAHPGLLRALILPAMHEFPKEWREHIGVSDGGGYGIPVDPIEDMPDGTIYLPCVRSAYGLPDPEEWLREKLTGLGLID